MQPVVVFSTNSVFLREMEKIAKGNVRIVQNMFYFYPTPVVWHRIISSILIIK